MQNTLAKKWGPYAAGTVVADNAAEAEATPGAIWVNAARFAKLHEGGFFEEAEPERPIPAEVMTGLDVEVPMLPPRRPHGPDTAASEESRIDRPIVFTEPEDDATESDEEA